MRNYRLSRRYRLRCQPAQAFEIMDSPSLRPLTLHTAVEQWPLVTPFRITGYTWEAVHVLVVSLEAEGHTGRGEAAGVYYKGENPASMSKQLAALRTRIEGGINRELVQQLLPPGGARNALDCALWDLEAKLTGSSVWEMAGLASPHPLLTTFTCGADEPDSMRRAALAYTHSQAIKLKLTGDPVDAERVRAVRDARTDAWLGVDANQGFTRPFLEWLMPVLLDARIQLIEQPFPIGQEGLLEGFRSPIPVAADESFQVLADLPKLAGRFDLVNIKLDKCGGLTEALNIARSANQLGLGAMVGNMTGTSLAMAPAFVVGQKCQLADLDGPIFLRKDRAHPVQYTDGLITCPESLWGYATA
jgi:L-alanine-DL-glutamate epimerase-like enolase superfamily enzyme